MEQGYTVSAVLSQRYSEEELQSLCSGNVVDLGWWTRFYGVEEMSQDELDELFERDIEDIRTEWRTELGIDRSAVLLSAYADGFYRGTCDLMSVFVEKQLYSDSEALPILFLACQFIELALKASIQYVVFFRQQMGRPIEDISLNTHNLSDLLSTLADLFESEELLLSRDTQTFIQKLDSINELAQACRYPFSVRGGLPREVFLTNAPLIPMRIFKEEFEIHGQELNGFHHWLAEGDFGQLEESETNEL